MIGTFSGERERERGKEREREIGERESKNTCTGE